jgi:hypothetical protein
MRDWLQTATGCNCRTLDVCGLFEGEPFVHRRGDGPTLRITRVDPARAGAGA